MKPYFFFSITLHGILTAALVFVGTLLSRPKMSYYAVDLFSSTPAGMAAAAPANLPAPVEKPEPIAPPKVVQETKPVPKEAIRVPSKEKPKAKAPPKPVTKPADKIKSSAAFQAAMRAASRTDRNSASVMTTNAGASVVAEAGPAFPYPWYLKTIADKLDSQWHPPQEFQSDTVCQVSFVIHQNGQVSDSSIEKRSGDQVFDQLAIRAILYASPLPPLPSGYPEESLRVHMKFVGKSQ